LVNGLPLVVIELKKPGVPARAAFCENLRKLVDPEAKVALSAERQFAAPSVFAFIKEEIAFTAAWMKPVASDQRV
jgi:type I site-specific restriction-modification system R (restriction) subunit